MKKQIIKTLVLILLGTSIIFSCKKKETTPETPSAPSTTGTATTTGGTTTGGTTTGGGTTNTLQANSWSEDGIVTTYTKTPNDLFWYKGNFTGSSSFDVRQVNGNVTKSIIIEMGSYLLPSGTYSIVPPSTNLQPNTVHLVIGSVSSNPVSFGSIYPLQGGVVTVTNQNGIFRVEFTNVIMKNASSTTSVNTSGKLEIALPTPIPPANAGYTIPAGVTPNSYILGATTFSPGQFGITRSNNLCKVELVNTTTLARLNFFFSTNFPPSGTYDVVSSKSAVVPGKVYVATDSYQSSTTLGGQVTVETTASYVSITAKNLSLSVITPGGAGNPVELLTANFKQ
jgi:hypothetical protein